jgi:hypothetical protein
MENRFIPPTRHDHDVELFRTDINTVETQFHAYGLIESEVTANTQGGANRFTQLTPLGRRRQLEWSTVKAPSESNTA